MSTSLEPPKYGFNRRSILSFEMTLRDRIWGWRYLILRRISQLSVLLLFYASVHWGWAIGEHPFLVGNLSSSELLGILPLADPFAVLQIIMTRHWIEAEVLLGAGIVLLSYGVLGGRVWCSWVCPINMVTDLAGWVRAQIGIRDMFRLSRQTRYGVLILTLTLSAISGVAAFEWISPISMFHRELIFGLGLGWTAVLGVFLFDLLILRHGWCGHLCPLGAFYGLLGRFAAIRIRFDAPTCTHCAECTKICPEPQVLNLKQAAEAGMVASGECTNCGRCTSVCPEDTLSFDWRPLIDTHNRLRQPGFKSLTGEK